MTSGEEHVQAGHLSLDPQVPEHPEDHGHGRGQQQPRVREEQQQRG